MTGNGGRAAITGELLHAQAGQRSVRNLGLMIGEGGVLVETGAQAMQVAGGELAPETAGTVEGFLLDGG